MVEVRQMLMDHAFLIQNQRSSRRFYESSKPFQGSILYESSFSILALLALARCSVLCNSSRSFSLIFTKLDHTRLCFFPKPISLQFYFAPLQQLFERFLAYENSEAFRKVMFSWLRRTKEAPLTKTVGVQGFDCLLYSKGVAQGKMGLQQVFLRRFHISCFTRNLIFCLMSSFLQSSKCRSDFWWGGSSGEGVVWMARTVMGMDELGRSN